MHVEKLMSLILFTYNKNNWRVTCRTSLQIYYSDYLCTLGIIITRYTFFLERFFSLKSIEQMLDS